MRARAEGSTRLQSLYTGCGLGALEPREFPVVRAWAGEQVFVAGFVSMRNDARDRYLRAHAMPLPKDREGEHAAPPGHSTLELMTLAPADQGAWAVGEGPVAAW